MPISLYDSLTRSQRELKPSHPDGVYRFYNCGPTVYAPAHIGNFRTFVVNDVIRRLLELEFPGKVKHVRNLTDVDDKTIKRARDEGRSLAEVTKQWTDKFHADCDALNCLRPHVEPAATDHIREQVDMIDVLMKKGNAYRAADGSVYFKVSSFDNYGRLSRVKERELQVGTALSHKSQAVDADEKEDATDFALWKAHKTEDGANSWDSPWGPGRPGWHIECSAMSKKHLGDTIDLHTGGEDLLFPHHENEIAQSECCNGTLFAHHWYHSKHLLVDGAKMSKSLGNLYTLDDLKAKGFSPMVVRATLLSGHPRSQLNFTFDSLHASRSGLNSLRKYIEDIIPQSSISKTDFLSWLSNPPNMKHWGPLHDAQDAVHDDLNIPRAMGSVFRQLHFATTGLKTKDEYTDILKASACLLFALGLNPFHEVQIQVPPDITALADKRWAAKAAKDWAAADALRKELTAAGWNMKDGKDGYTLEPLKK
jgi:cysteinyl-tRNA synthetase